MLIRLTNVVQLRQSYATAIVDITRLEDLSDIILYVRKCIVRTFRWKACLINQLRESC